MSRSLLVEQRKVKDFLRLGDLSDRETDRNVPTGDTSVVHLDVED